MEFRLQHLILIACACTCASTTVLSQERALNLNKDYFEIGVNAGVLAIQDFNSEYSFGVNATFQASEDFFLQSNYVQADASLSAFENSQGQYFGGGDRTFSYYDILIGYNLLQGEFYPSEGKSTLSSLYTVAGVGNVSFGGEDSFATTLGIGYKLELRRRLNLRLDFRDIIYDSILTPENKTTHNTRVSIGISYVL
jgi:outer membrane beta-barrel protein